MKELTTFISFIHLSDGYTNNVNIMSFFKRIISEIADQSNFSTKHLITTAAFSSLHWKLYCFLACSLKLLLYYSHRQSHTVIIWLNCVVTVFVCDFFESDDKIYGPYHHGHGYIIKIMFGYCPRRRRVVYNLLGVPI